jgi:SAM-dependent methyltransferase
MGKAQSPEWYDQAFRDTPMYQGRYNSSPYYQMWKDVCRLLSERAGELGKKIEKFNIVEFGCGVGQFAEMLYEYGYRKYHGYDFSEEAIKRAIGKAPFEFTRVDLESVDGGKYCKGADIVIILETLEHLDNDLKVLSDIPNDTYVLLTVPKFDGTSHVRHFVNVSDASQRYGQYITVDTEIFYRDHFLLGGYRNDK